MVYFLSWSYENDSKTCTDSFAPYNLLTGMLCPKGVPFWERAASLFQENG